LSPQSCCLVLVLLAPIPACGQDFSLLDCLFLDAALHSYFAPPEFSEFLKPELGFRASLGFDLQYFRVSVESGYTRITGTNPLVRGLREVPLIFKAGFNLPLFLGLGLRLELGLGVLFSEVTHYRTVIAMLQDEERTSKNRGPVSGWYLDLYYRFPGDFVSLYAGGGVDLVPEISGPIALPLLRAGLSFKPVALGKKLAALRRKKTRPAPEPEGAPPVSAGSLKEAPVGLLS
jgi:hypothetical protein